MHASVLKRSTRADCKSAGLAFASSNLARRTNLKSSMFNEHTTF